MVVQHGLEHGARLTLVLMYARWKLDNDPRAGPVPERRALVDEGNRDVTEVPLVCEPQDDAVRELACEAQHQGIDRCGIDRHRHDGAGQGGADLKDLPVELDGVRRRQRTQNRQVLTHVRQRPTGVDAEQLGPLDVARTDAQNEPSRRELRGRLGLLPDADGMPATNRQDRGAEIDAARHTCRRSEHRERVRTEKVWEPHTVKPSTLSIRHGGGRYADEPVIEADQAHAHPTMLAKMTDVCQYLAVRQRSPTAARLTEVIFLIARVRPMLDEFLATVAAEVGLTAAGWHVASALGGSPATVPEIAKTLGRRRQSVQVAVDDLVSAGYAAKRENPRNARSPHIELTPRGVAAFWAVADRHTAWMNNHADRFNRTALDAAARVLEELVELMEDETNR